MDIPANFPDRNVSVIGLGYVGLTLAVAMADVGFSVAGIEISETILSALKSERAHFSETGLSLKLKEQLRNGRFVAYSRLSEAPRTSSVYIVTVGTPIGPQKQTLFNAMTNVIEQIAAVLKNGDMVILRSTVRVRTTRDFVKPILDKAGVSYHLAFCPERTLEGRALVELRSLPQVVGGMDDVSTFRASQMFSLLTPSVVRVRDPETAELVKLVNNTQRDYVFAFANEVAAMCDALGISAAEVIASGNLGYPRANLPMPGPVGGPCLEKDPYILAEGLAGFGYTPTLSLAARNANEDLPRWTLESIARRFGDSAVKVPTKIALLGLAFKGRPETNDMRGTLAIPIIEKLRYLFPAATIVGWDAIVPQEEVVTLGIVPADTLAMAFEQASLVLIQNNHECFERMPLRELAESMTRPGIVYDYWNQHDVRTTVLPDGISYYGLGTMNIATAATLRDAI